MSGNVSYKPAYPYNLAELPPQVNITEEMLNLLIQARAELGELKGYSFSMPNPLLLLSPAIIKESLASSEIENINTTMIDVLENQLFPESEQKQPDKEVLRYRDSILWGEANLERLTLSTRLILGIKQKLLPGSPEGYRTAQNGIENSTTKGLIYTPPVAASIPGLLGNLENYMNKNDVAKDPLIRTIISHYQFEAIHPFSDGNGRTGRILIVLQLIRLGILNSPILYISGYINKNRSEYYKRLLAVTTHQDWEAYILFMLKGFYYQAIETKDFMFKIMTLYLRYKRIIKEKHRSFYSADMVEVLFSYPVVTPARFSTELGIHRETASRYLNLLVKSELLVDRRVGKYHFFVNKQLMDILHG